MHSTAPQPPAPIPSETDDADAKEKAFQECLFPAPKPPSPAASLPAAPAAPKPVISAPPGTGPAPVPAKELKLTDTTGSIQKSPDKGSGPAAAPPPAEAKIDQGPTFIKIDPKNLPSSLGAGSLAEIKTALQRQVSTCKRQDNAQEKDKEKEKTTKIKVKTADGVQIKELAHHQYCTQTNTELLSIANSITNPDGKESKGDVPRFMEAVKNHFDWYQSNCFDEKGKGNAFFTGYHGPILDASHNKQGEFQTPIYRNPPELKRIRTVDLQDGKTCESFKKRPEVTVESSTVACMQDDNGTRTPPDRAAIMNGYDGFNGREKELVIGYAKSDMDLYLFQVEGAGTLKFSETDFVYANTGNTMSFKRIMMGRILKCRGVPENQLGTAQLQRQYFLDHKDQIRPDLELIRNYLFFDDSKKGILGVDDLELSGASAATDQKVIATGLPLIIAAPKTESLPATAKHAAIIGHPAYSAFKVAQDKGSAINGGCHVDVYYGAGNAAEDKAGDMTDHGDIFIALPKEPEAAVPIVPGAASVPLPQPKPKILSSGH